MSKSNQVQQFYEEVPFPQDRVETMEDLNKHYWILNSLPNKEIKKGSKILDAGCGTGEMACFLSQFGEVTGIDFSENSIKKANELKEKLKIKNIDFRVDDLTNLKLKEKFDYIFCMGVLHHIPTLKKALKNLKDLMNDESLLVICVYNKIGTKITKIKYSLFPTITNRIRFDDLFLHPFMKTYYKNEFREILEENGFEIVNIWRNIPEVLRITGKGMMMSFCVCKFNWEGHADYLDSVLTTEYE